MLDAEVTPDAFLSLALRALPLENERAERQRGSCRTCSEAYWRYLAAGDVAHAGAAARAGAARRTRRAAAPSLKSVWFSALRDIAQTPATIDWLTRVWKRGGEGPGPDAGRDRLHPPRAGARRARRARRGRASSISSSSGRRTRIARRSSRSCGRRCRPIRASATRGSRRSPTSPTAAASRGCSKGCAICTIRCAPPPRRSTSSRACSCCARSSGPATSSFPKRWMDATLSGHQSAGRRRHRPRLRRAPAAGLSRAPAARHPVVRRRSLSGEQTAMTRTRRTQ